MARKKMAFVAEKTFVEEGHGGNWKNSQELQKSNKNLKGRAQSSGIFFVFGVQRVNEKTIFFSKHPGPERRDFFSFSFLGCNGLKREKMFGTKRKLTFHS